MCKLLHVVLILKMCSRVLSQYRNDIDTENKFIISRNKSMFGPLGIYQVGADPVPESKYPWIGRVMHSRTAEVPYMCTTACIQKRIFITAARCIFSLKVTYTSVAYQKTRLPALAFVFPSNSSKQQFDDIGFIVVRSGFEGVWATIDLFNAVNRTDDNFQWFADLDVWTGPNAHDYKVVGYATDKRICRLSMLDLSFPLSELTVYIDIELCSHILVFNRLVEAFHVPCYHSCELEQFRLQSDNCVKYHGIEGGAVIDVTTNKLVGIATWGSYFLKYELPVGFSVPNSENFFKDYECAIRIRNDDGALDGIGYQSLCEDS